MTQPYFSYEIPRPALRRGEDSELFSEQFEDGYWSKAGARAESRYIFMGLNELHDVFQSPDREDIVIGEIGFGSGLNFLETVELFNRFGENQTLHYIGFECFPLRVEDLVDFLSSSDFSEESISRLAALWRDLIPGLNSFTFIDRKVKLTIVIGDATEWISEANASVNVWFLDGFAPSKNPLAWSERLLSGVTRLSAPGATLSSFSVAGSVRNPLQQLGWEVKKVPGFGGKREALSATLSLIESPATIHSLPAERSALIVGGGIAGLSLGYSLSIRGWKVTVLEKHSALGLGASSNYAGLVMPHLGLIPDERSLFTLAGARYTVRLVEWLVKQRGYEIEHDFEGVLRLPYHPQLQRLIERFDSIGIASEVAFLEKMAVGQASDSEEVGLFFPRSGWISPRSLVAALADLLQREGGAYHTGIDAGSVTFSEGGWKVAEHQASHLFLATGDQGLPIRSDGASWEVGRLSRTKGEVILLSTGGRDLDCPPIPVCARGYVLPFSTGEVLVGATYDRSELSWESTQEARETLLEYGEDVIPGLKECEVIEARARVRAGTPDRLPYVGPIRGAPNAFASLGYGSRGFSWAPLAAEYLAALVSGEPLPIAQSITTALRPERFFDAEE